MSTDPLPAFDSSGRLRGPTTERRRRALVLAAGALVLAVLAASVVNAGRASLRCMEGLLIPHRGRLLPLGETPLDDSRLSPLPVPSALCEDETFESRAELETRYYEIAVGRVDQALRGDDDDALASASRTLEAMNKRGPGENGEIAERRRALAEKLLGLYLQRARESRQRALEQLEQARLAGVDDEVLTQAAQALHAVPPQPEIPAATNKAPATTPDPSTADAGEAVAAEPEGSPSAAPAPSSRAL